MSGLSHFPLFVSFPPLAVLALLFLGEASYTNLSPAALSLPPTRRPHHHPPPPGTVHMVCRNPEYAETARSEIVNETKNENVHVHILDLSKTKV